MWPKRLDLRLFVGIVTAAVLVVALACSSADDEEPAAPAQPAAPAPAAPAAPAPSAPAPAAPAPAPAPSAPAPAPAAPAPSGGFDVSGTLTIAVTDVNSPNGLPRFCTAGCAETIYISGITDVLFMAKENADGSTGIEPMVALDFTLDPGLEFGTFNLRDDVEFHDGWGKMTAADVAFSYNDANSVTNPESIHGQAGDFAPLIQSMEAIDDNTLQLNYRNYDSRGVLHRFSYFWQTAGIVSKKVFDDLGVEGMQDAYIGVGPFVADEWSDDKGIFMTANSNYYATKDGLGPFIEKVRWLQVPESASRRAMLETEEAQIANIPLKDLAELKSKGFQENRDGNFNTIRDISSTGNYWEQFSALTGEALDRDRDITVPHVGNPFELGDTYDETTPSMVKAIKVRQAFAWSIEREKLLANLISGFGFVNHQAYLSSNDPNFRSEWEWGTDFDKARAFLADAGFADGFEQDMWVGTSETGSELGESIGAAWDEQLGVKTNLIKTNYSTYRPGLVARTTNTLGLFICGDENKSNFPFDWAHGFVVSSISAGGYGVGQEIPYASESYLAMSAEPDKVKRNELAARFYTENRRLANCIGIYEEPIWPVFNPNKVSAWDQRPQANGNLNLITNVRSIKLK